MSFGFSRSLSRLLAIVLACAMALAFTGGPVLAMQSCPAEAKTVETLQKTDHSCCSASAHDADGAPSDGSSSSPTDHCTPECMAVCCAAVATPAAPEMLGISIDVSTVNQPFVQIPPSAGPADPQLPPPRI